jgi:hypothetical protein
MERAIWTVNEERDYLGMSAIGRCPRQLYHDLVNGRQKASTQSQKVFYEGYLHERDVLSRLEQSGWPVAAKGYEVVSSWSGRFRGHVDGVLVLHDKREVLLEIKSTRRDRFDQVRDHGPLAEHVAQVTMYMRYGAWDACILVYKCREDGDLWTHYVAYDDDLGDVLEEKAQMILAAVEAQEPPLCTCGRCHNGR